jgi:hypothetical protein
MWGGKAPISRSNLEFRRPAMWALESITLTLTEKYHFSIEDGGGGDLPGPLCPMVTEPLALTTDRAPMFIVLYYSSTDLYYHHMT